MTVSLYLAGEPGVGRSTLMGELLTGWTMHPAVRLRGGLRGEPFGTPDRVEGVHLGVRGGPFSGTDQLPASALSDGVAWAHLTRALPRFVFGEGSRLAHSRFLTALADRGPLLYVYLTAPEDVCARRRTEQAVALGRPPFPNGAAVAVRARAKHLARLCTVIPGATVISVDTNRLDPSQAADAVRRILEAL